MRGVIFLLSIVVLFVGSCERKPNKQAAVDIGDADSLAVDNLSKINHIGHESTDRKNDTIAPNEVSEAEISVTKNDWKSIWKGMVCKEYDTDDGYTQHKDCSFPNAKLKQVFDIVRRLDVNIRTELPETTLNDTCIQKGCICVDFQYKSKKHLFIKIRYQGGEDYIEIIEKDGSTVAKITNSAD
jgi:hypothetical protein